MASRARLVGVDTARYSSCDGGHVSMRPCCAVLEMAHGTVCADAVQSCESSIPPML